MARKYKLPASKTTASNLQLKRVMSLPLRTSLVVSPAWLSNEKTQRLPNSTLMQLKVLPTISSIEKARMKIAKALLFVTLQPIKRASSIALLIQVTLIHIQFRQFWESVQHLFQILLRLLPLVSSWTIVTLAFSMALPLEIGLTQSSLAEQKNTPISQMGIIPIKMQQQPFLSMDLVLKSTDSNLLN